MRPANTSVGRIIRRCCCERSGDGRSDEIEDVKLDRLLPEAAARAGFALHRQMVELVGVCGDYLAFGL